MKNPKWVMNCNALSKVIFEKRKGILVCGHKLTLIFSFLLPKITVIYFCVTFYILHVAAMKCLKQDHKGHVIVSLMLLISLLLTFFESCMKQRIQKIIRTSNIMIHSYSLHIIYKNLYD